MLVSAIQQCESAISTHTSPSSWNCLPLPLPHPSRSSQGTRLSSLCYKATSHYLSISHMTMYIFQCYSQFITPSPSLTVPASPSSTSSSLFLPCKLVLQYHFSAAVVVRSLSCVQLFATPWTAAHQSSLSFTISRSLFKRMPIESVMPSNHLILCHPLLLLPSVFPSIRVFSKELALQIKWPKYWSFSFSISLSKEYSGLISFRIDWFDVLAVQGTLKSLLQHHFVRFRIYAKNARIFVMKNLYLFLC